MKTEDELRSDWRRIDNEDIDQVCDILRRHEYRASDYLAGFVAALCDVTVEEMFANTNVARLTHARWLFWYAYRHHTGQSYDAIARHTSHFGHAYDLKTVQNAVNKMSTMIDTTREWERRWTVVKRLMKLRDEEHEKNMLCDVKKPHGTIIISVPKEMKEWCSVQIKER